MKKTLIQIASAIFPSLITSFAYHQLTNPQLKKLRANELTTLEKAETESFPFKDFKIKLYTWKGGSKKVLLIHGWEGQAGNFSDLIERLIVSGYTVYSFDGPSHGFSSRGKTSLFEFTELVGELIRKFEVRDLVSHSFGGVATTYALFSNQDLEIDKYILLTTPDKFTERIDDVAEMVGINNKVKRKLIQRLEKEVNLDVKSLNVSDFVKSVNVKKSMIIHDKNDKVIPISRSLNVHNNWPVSEFKTISGTGHFRILRTKEVIDTVVEYLTPDNVKKNQLSKEEDSELSVSSLIEDGNIEKLHALAIEKGVLFIKMNSDKEELAALHWAASTGNVELVKFFLDPPVNEDPAILRGNNFSPLHSSAMMGHTEVVELLIAYGADINVQTNPQNYAPIHSASFGGHLETVKSLVKHGADIHLQNYRREYPIDTAKRQGQALVVAYFESLQ